MYPFRNKRPYRGSVASVIGLSKHRQPAIVKKDPAPASRRRVSLKLLVFSMLVSL